MSASFSLSTRITSSEKHFSVVIFLRIFGDPVVEENEALLGPDGHYCTYSLGGRLDLRWRARQCVGHYA